MNDGAGVPSYGHDRFDVRAFTRTAQGNLRNEFDLTAFAEVPLPGDALRMVRYLRDLEASTMAQLRNVLVTATHKDARVTAFLVSWAYEKFWIADALEAILEANATASASPDSGKRRHAHSEAPDRRGPVWRAISAMRIGTAIVAVHMASGAIDEWITRAAYEHVDESAGNPVLTPVIARLLEVKSRHCDFFGQEARRRLSESPRAVRLANRSLSRIAWPLGSIARSADDRSFFENSTFGDAAGRTRANEIEQRILSLPGLEPRVAADIRSRLVL